MPHSISGAHIVIGLGDRAMPCDLCGMIHPYLCPRVKAIEFDGNGNVLRLELQDNKGSMPVVSIPMRPDGGRPVQPEPVIEPVRTGINI